MSWIELNWIESNENRWNRTHITDHQQNESWFVIHEIPEIAMGCNCPAAALFQGHWPLIIDHCPLVFDLDLRSSMFDVWCLMFDVRCSMSNLRSSILDTRSSVFDDWPLITNSHRYFNQRNNCVRFGDFETKSWVISMSSICYCD
jgi:hypothetical protein